jgi:hypothetical protein
MLGDNLRGLIELPMDLHECPDKVESALDILTDWAIAGVEGMDPCGAYAVDGSHDFTAPPRVTVTPVRSRVVLL